MTTTTSSTAPAGADFSQLSTSHRELAAQLGIELILFPGGFGAKKDCDILAEDLTAAEIKEWLEGYLNGRDEIDVPALLNELALADQIIMTLVAQMNDSEKESARSSLVIAGFEETHTIRCKQRHNLIATTRQAISAS
ncbi:hypothetical protein ACQ4WP_03380 [Janthinobacterium sp. GB4P2]|uniref:hypothetical protein n=1 Tax=Janthinobacterium sp. GB4P2 TaxID=3424189 RepID=UPI003F2495AB